jgi:predicted nucleic acid-binding protein
MKRFVLDASVLIKLFFEEEHSEAAVRAVKNATDLLAPELLWAESANVIWKRVRRGEIDSHIGATLVEDLLRVPVRTFSELELVGPAFSLASETGRTVYDCLYLALAIRENIPLLTGDERLYNAINTGPFAKRICFVGSGD